MRVLIDECLPAGLKESFAALGHECQTVRRAGYGAKKNGELLSLIEGQWDVLVTNDRNIKYQQNMSSRNVSILVLCAKSNRIQDLLPLMPACAPDRASRYR
jgi:predicted nuclease of predicted toxin-antitoxin system